MTSAMSSRDAAGESPRAVVWRMKGEHRTQGRWFTLQLRMRAMAAEREGQGGERGAEAELTVRYCRAQGLGQPPLEQFSGLDVEFCSACACPKPSIPISQGI